MRKKPPLPTDEEVQALKGFFEKQMKTAKILNDQDWYIRALRDYLIFMILLTTGRRVSEVLNIYPQNIDWDKHVIYTVVFKREKMPKEVPDDKRRMAEYALFIQTMTDYTRPVGMTPEVERLLQEYIELKKPGPWEPVFDVSRAYVAKKFREAREALGIKREIVPHSLRAYLITKLVEQGWTYEEIRKITGHKSIKTLQIYDRATYFQVKDKHLQAVEKLVNGT